jgi:predicted secreted hydrolase
MKQGWLALPALFAAGLAAGPEAPAGEDWKIAEPGHRWSFPRDHWPHDGYKTEWWYFVGNLKSVEDPSTRFGYQFTIFKVGLVAASPGFESAWSAGDLILGHAAITDMTAGDHVFSETLHRASPLLGGFRPFPERPIASARSPAGTDGAWVLDWTGDGFHFSARDDAKAMAFDLRTIPDKPLVFQGPGGVSRKGEEKSSASLYYSFPRLATGGWIELAGRRHRVSGESWMDKEFGSSQLSTDQVGWDWFSLRLDDGRDLMLFVLRREDGSPDFRSGTVIATDGSPRYLDADEWTVTVTDHWESPETGGRYPAGWILRVPKEGLALHLEPLVPDQENRGGASGISYWEGAVEVRSPDGTAAGQGYVEMTGYGRGSRPPV